MSYKFHVHTGRFARRLLVTLIALIASSRLAPAATRVWSGSAGILVWSDPANWSNGVPVNGDSVLLLRHPLGLPQNAVNDLTNLTLASIRCEAPGYTLSGGTLRLTESVLMGGPIAGASLTINAPIDIPGTALNIVSTNGSELTLAGLITAPPSAVVTVEGGLRLRAITNGGYQATTRLLSGFYALLFVRLDGPVIVGGTPAQFASVALQSGNVIGNSQPLTILTNGALFNISTFQSVGPFTVDGGVLRLGNRSPQGEIAVSGPALFTGGASVFVTAINQFGPGSLSVTGTVTIAGCSLAFQPGSTTITQPAVIVRNDGTDPIAGSFNGLPEGAELTNNLVRYVVSYVGGDGNDITLSPVVEAPVFISATRSSGEVEHVVRGQPGFTYVVEAVTDLVTPISSIPWAPIRTNTISTGTTFSFTDPESTNLPHRLYRIVKP